MTIDEYTERLEQIAADAAQIGAFVGRVGARPQIREMKKLIPISAEKLRKSVTARTYKAGTTIRIKIGFQEYTKPRKNNGQFQRWIVVTGSRQAETQSTDLMRSVFQKLINRRMERE